MLFTVTSNTRADKALGKMQMFAQTPKCCKQPDTWKKTTMYSLPKPYYTSQ